MGTVPVAEPVESGRRREATDKEEKLNFEKNVCHYRESSRIKSKSQWLSHPEGRLEIFTLQRVRFYINNPKIHQYEEVWSKEFNLKGKILPVC